MPRMISVLLSMTPGYWEVLAAGVCSWEVRHGRPIQGFGRFCEMADLLIDGFPLADPVVDDAAILGHGLSSWTSGCFSQNSFSSTSDATNSAGANSSRKQNSRVMIS